MQIATFFETNVGPVAKLNVQRDCRRLISLGSQRHTARLATERTLQRLLRYGCGCGNALNSNSNTSPNTKYHTPNPKNKSPASISGSVDANATKPEKVLLSPEKGATSENTNKESHAVTNESGGGKKLRNALNLSNSLTKVAPGVVAEAVESLDDKTEQNQGTLQYLVPIEWCTLFSIISHR